MRPGLCLRPKKYSQIERGTFGLECEDVANVPRGFPLHLGHLPSAFDVHNGPEKAVAVTAAARTQCWCLFLGAFSYSIEFRGNKQHVSRDGLSRLPQLSAPADKLDEVEIFHTSVVEALPVTEQELRMQTRRDPVLSRVLELVQSGWQGTEVHPELIPCT